MYSANKKGFSVSSWIKTDSPLESKAPDDWQQDRKETQIPPHLKLAFPFTYTGELCGCLQEESNGGENSESRSLPGREQ